MTKTISTPSTIEKTEQPQRTEKLYMENTLLRVAGVLFCHDPKRARARVKKIEINKGVPEKRITIAPHSAYGQPGVLAHKLFIAILKKHSDYGRPMPDAVSFNKREIMRMTGRSEWGGKDSAELARALREIRNTEVTAFFQKGARYFERSFNVISDILFERRNSHDDPIEACSVALGRPILESLEDQHFTCLNHFLMQRLGTIGQALYMRLFFHFANLYDERNRKRLSFSKHYEDICEEWLGGIAVHKHKSLIERDQLGQHLKQLINVGFLASYKIEKGKTRDGLVITFRPGAAFFHDYDRFYRYRQQGDLQFDFHADRQEVMEPIKVAYLFAERRSGAELGSVSFAPSHDVEAAKEILKHIAFADMPGFLDFALERAKATEFDVQTLGGLKQYITMYLTFKKRQEAQKAREAAQQAEERQRLEHAAYDRYLRTQADQLFTTLPNDEKAVIEGLARGKAAGIPAGSLKTVLYETSRARLTAERHARRLPTFDQWKQSQVAR